jgi:hypothetical protein
MLAVTIGTLTATRDLPSRGTSCRVHATLTRASGVGPQVRRHYHVRMLDLLPESG